MRVISAGKLKAFHLAGMTGSFKHAAHLLAISPSAVSARIRSLERELGVRLFNRAARELSLSEAGAVYIREVEEAFASLEVATRELRARFAPRAAEGRHAQTLPVRVARAGGLFADRDQRRRELR